MSNGQLKVKMLAANFTHDPNFIFSMDSYVEGEVGQYKQTTKPSVYRGKDPVWEEVLTFAYTGEPILHLRFMDKGFLGDKKLGEFYVALEVFPSNQYTRGQYPITLNGAQVGVAHIEVKIEGSIRPTPAAQMMGGHGQQAFGAHSSYQAAPGQQYYGQYIPGQQYAGQQGYGAPSNHSGTGMPRNPNPY